MDTISPKQFGFMPERFTTKAVFTTRQKLQEIRALIPGIPGRAGYLWRGTQFVPLDRPSRTGLQGHSVTKIKNTKQLKAAIR